MKVDSRKWLRRGGAVALAMTTIISAGCGGGGGGGGGGSGATASSSNNSGANSPPTISATPTTQVSVGSSYSLTPRASDADGDSLAFSIQNKPNWAQFNTATGQLTGTPTAQNTTSNIVISVSDGKASASLPAFSITVGTSATPGSAAPSGPGVSLSWDVPTRTEDGATLQDLSGYRIHYGTNQNVLVNSIEVQSAGSNTFTVQNLKPGTYYFAVRAVAANGSESKLSNIISRTVS